MDMTASRVPLRSVVFVGSLLGCAPPAARTHRSIGCLSKNAIHSTHVVRVKDDNAARKLMLAIAAKATTQRDVRYATCRHPIPERRLRWEQDPPPAP